MCKFNSMKQTVEQNNQCIVYSTAKPSTEEVCEVTDSRIGEIR